MDELKSAMSEVVLLVGTTAPVQFAALFQVVLRAPLHVIVAACTEGTMAKLKPAAKKAGEARNDMHAEITASRENE